MQGLTSWTNADASMATFSVKEFEAFLPGGTTTLGQPWYIVESRFGKGGMMYTALNLHVCRLSFSASGLGVSGGGGGGGACFFPPP